MGLSVWLRWYSIRRLQLRRICMRSLCPHCTGSHPFAILTESGYRDAAVYKSMWCILFCLYLSASNFRLDETLGTCKVLCDKASRIWFFAEEKSRRPCLLLSLFKNWFPSGKACSSYQPPIALLCDALTTQNLGNGDHTIAVQQRFSALVRSLKTALLSRLLRTKPMQCCL